MKKISYTLILTLLISTLFAGSVSASSSTATKKDDTTMNSYIADVIGTKYKYGGTSVKTGFDCSGFVGHIFRKMGYDIDRRSSDIAKSGTKVAKDELIPGDLVFFDTSGKNNGGITHVGIYVGDGQFAHASTSKGVRYDSLDSSYYKPRYVTARRVLQEKDYIAFATVKPVEENVAVAAETPAAVEPAAAEVTATEQNVVATEVHTN